MTVKELKKKLNGVPDHLDVFIKQTDDSFAIQPVETAKVIEAEFHEDSGPLVATADVFMLTDEF